MTAVKTPGHEHLFAQVVGQERAVSLLVAAATRPVHAYLFLGPPGSGRRAAARGFAAALICPEGGCGRCPECAAALGGRHPDVVVIERQGPAVGVDEARRLAAAAQRRPFRASRQVIVVTDVHLAERSAPALLKTLEEPPSPTVFILLADHVPPALATVASRCVEVPFHPLAPPEVEAFLLARGVDASRAAHVAHRCGGDLNRARLLAEDEHFSERVALWRSVPDRLDGSGAAVAIVARELLAAGDEALQPLRAQHQGEEAALSAQAEALGERGLPQRRELKERHHREERQWRTAELLAGLGELARTYRDRMLDALRLVGQHPGANVDAAAFGRCVNMVSAAGEALEHHPNELLLLEALLVRLSAL